MTRRTGIFIAIAIITITVAACLVLPALHAPKNRPVRAHSRNQIETPNISFSTNATTTASPR